MVAQYLNIFQSSLHLQYRLSTDNKGSLPCDLTSQRCLDILISILRPLIVPPILANGRRSTRAMKSVAVQVFIKGDDEVLSTTNDGKVCYRLFLALINTNYSKQRNAASSKSLQITDQDRPKSESEIFHEKRIIARKEITDAFACPIHSLPDKPALCWKDPVQSVCLPITENNLNYWATLSVRVRLPFYL